MWLSEWGDISREWLSLTKIVHFFRTIIEYKVNLILQKVELFSQIDFSRLREQWIDSIILDIDDCVAPHHGAILPENMIIIQQLLLLWWKVVIFSNMKKSDRYKVLEESWAQVCTSRFAKPDPRGFDECLNILNSAPDATVMIWDNYLTDGGSVLAGIPYIRVMPIWSEKSSTMRTLQVGFRNFVRWVVEARIK